MKKNIEQTKEQYLSPLSEVMELNPESLICQSPGAGGSEGTGDEPLFAPPGFFNSFGEFGGLF